jgi:hypothetical protein
MEDESKDKIPGLDSPKSWAEVIGILAILVLLNIVAFFVSFGAGIIVTVPLTLILAFMLIRDVAPRHRLPPGRPHGGATT